MPESNQMFGKSSGDIPDFLSLQTSKFKLFEIFLWVGLCKLRIKIFPGWFSYRNTAQW